MQKDLVIVGMGPAALSAGMYASGRYMVKTAIVGDIPGGTMALAGKIENYPGVLPIDGFGLFRTMRKQAEEAGAEIVSEKIVSIKKEGDIFLLKGEKNNFETKAVIYAAGNEWRKLGIANEKELTGKGVHYCAVCDGPLYKGKTVVVVGGGNSSVKAANLLAEYAEKVYLITIDKEISAEPANLEKMKVFGEKIEVFLETKIKEIKGTDKLEVLILDGLHSEELKTDGLFVEIGADPNTGLIKEIGIALDEKGYIKIDGAMATNISGFFAAGDITGLFGKFKQVITAAAMGATAANSAYEYLAGKPKN